jgi:hypothetical protein
LTSTTPWRRPTWSESSRSSRTVPRSACRAMDLHDGPALRGPACADLVHQLTCTTPASAFRAEALGAAAVPDRHVERIRHLGRRQRAAPGGWAAVTPEALATRDQERPASLARGHRAARDPRRAPRASWALLAHCPGPRQRLRPASMVCLV